MLLSWVDAAFGEAETGVSRALLGLEVRTVGEHAAQSVHDELMSGRNKDDAGPVLLSGGNPQIPKGEGEGPVRDYLAAMPGWKRAVGERLDALIVRTVPDVRKAVKWNQPLYGLDGQGWFLSFRCYTNYVQLQFFRGTSLHPVPPKPSKHAEIRYFDIRESDAVDEAQLRSWIEQAHSLPGEKM